MKTLIKLQDLKFNEFAALEVIELDSDLMELFKDEVKTSIKVVKTLSENNKLDDNIKTYIRDLFDKVILTKQSLISKYQYKLDKIQNQSSNKTQESKLPRRYGKDKIIQDIAKQDGKATNAQKTALAVNELKNLYVNLNSRMVKELLTDEKNITDVEYREIRSAITTIKNKLNPILNKNKK